MWIKWPIWLWLLFLVALFLAISTHAKPSSQSRSVVRTQTNTKVLAKMTQARQRRVKRTQRPNIGTLETGLSIGTPSGINLVVGLWGDDNFPFLLRASGMSLGHLVRGGDVQLGWVFDPYGDFWQYIAVGVSATEINLTPHTEQGLRLYGVGPYYGFRWSGFILNLGIIFGSSNKFHLGEKTKAEFSSPFAQFSIGYTFLWW